MIVVTCEQNGDNENYRVCVLEGASQTVVKNATASTHVEAILKVLSQRHELSRPSSKSLLRMTESHIDFFSRLTDKRVSAHWIGMPEYFTLEQLYQAFRARLDAERAESGG